MPSIAYLPFSKDYSRDTYIVRSVGPNPLAMATALRRAISLAPPDFIVSTVRTQNELIDSHTVRDSLGHARGVLWSSRALIGWC
jgi:hypothetical protein